MQSVSLQAGVPVDEPDFRRMSDLCSPSHLTLAKEARFQVSFHIEGTPLKPACFSINNKHACV